MGSGRAGSRDPKLALSAFVRRQCQEHTRSSSAAARYTLFRCYMVQARPHKVIRSAAVDIIAEEEIPSVYGPRFVLQEGVQNAEAGHMTPGGVRKTSLHLM